MTQRTQLIIASLCVSVGLTLGGCSSAPHKEQASSSYQDYKNKDGKPAKSLYDVDVSQIPDAEPRDEPFSRFGNKSPYVVFGETYTVLPSPKGYKERGIASWYGADFHGKKTSSWETYDMFRMTAAHKSLPLPCYVKVTNLQNGKQIIVKVNDRGPFHEGRIIDLSFAAAKKLDMAVNGTSQVEVEALDPADFNSKTWMDTVATTNAIKVAPGVMTMPVDPMPAVKAETKGVETASAEPNQGAVTPVAASTKAAASGKSTVTHAAASNKTKASKNAVATTAPDGTKAVHLANGKTVFLPVTETKPTAKTTEPGKVADNAEPAKQVADKNAKPTVNKTEKANKPELAAKDNDTHNAKDKTKATQDKPAISKTTTDKPATDKSKNIYLQVGAYAQQENAELLKDKLTKLKLSKPVVISNDQSKHKVQVGPFETEQLAMQMQQRIRDANMGAPLIVRN